MIWNEHYESMDRDKLTALQSRRLIEQIQRVYEKVPFYRRKMQEKGLTPSDIKHISDITKLPFTTKDDMREVYPLGLLAVDPGDIV